jgi:hypothetical protein
VLVRGRVAAGATGGTRVIPLPKLGYRADQNSSLQEVPVTQTLCTVYQLAPGALRLDGDLVNDTELDAHRLKHLADVLDQAAPLATDYSPSDLENWYSVWGRRFFVVQQRLQSIAAPGSTDDRLRQALQQARQRHAAVLPQLKVDGTFQQLQAERELSDSSRVWLDALPRAVSVHYQATPAGVAQLNVRFEPAVDVRWPWRVAIVLALGLAAGALQRWPRSPREVAPRWPMIAGVLVGLAWWLWLEPSLLGWGIVGLSLLVMVLLP